MYAHKNPRIECWFLGDLIYDGERKTIMEPIIENNIGKFMVAAAAILVNVKTRKLLILKRSDYSGLENDAWEIPCGRIAQHEDLIAGLKREVREETGITSIDVEDGVNTWHTYRDSE